MQWKEGEREASGEGLSMETQTANGFVIEASIHQSQAARGTLWPKPPVVVFAVIKCHVVGCSREGRIFFSQLKVYKPD